VKNGSGSVGVVGIVSAVAAAIVAIAIVALALPERPSALADSSASDEVNLYTKEGKAVAYIATTDSDKIVYLWDGTAKVYLVEDGVYTFPGKCIGWFAGGYVYDREGLIRGCTEQKLEAKPSSGLAKRTKGLTPVKGFAEDAPKKPTLSEKWSDTDLDEFLKAATK
jgi:hypothetical protein